VPTRIMIISDSAFRKEDAKGLAMRGAIIAVAETSSTHPGGALHVIEFYARKQRRVTRSTYSAELNAMSDAIETGKLISMCLSELMVQMPLARQLIEHEEAGTLPMPMECAIDARSVYDSLIQDEIRPPTENSLVMMLCQIKELMLTHSLRKIWWIDTRDMIADGLNKGACSREGLLALSNNGTWSLQHEARGFAETRHVPIAPSERLRLPG